MLVQQRGPTTPDVPRHTRFGLFPGRSPLLGESLTYFLFLRVLRCFSSPRSPHDTVMMTALRRPGCPIRKSAGQGSFAPNRGLSQLITSFIASVSLGIHHAPLLSFPSFSDSRNTRPQPCASSFCLACTNMSKIFSPLRASGE